MISQLVDDFYSERNAGTVTSSDSKNSTDTTDEDKDKEKDKDKDEEKDKDGSKGNGGYRTKDEEIMQRLTAFASFLITGAR